MNVSDLQAQCRRRFSLTTASVPLVLRRWCAQSEIEGFGGGWPGVDKAGSDELCRGRSRNEAINPLIWRIPTFKVANVLPVEHRTPHLQEGVGHFSGPLHVAVLLHALANYIVDRRLGSGR